MKKNIRLRVIQFDTNWEWGIGHWARRRSEGGKLIIYYSLLIASYFLLLTSNS